MKRLAVLILVAALVLLVVGCGRRTAKEARSERGVTSAEKSRMAVKRNATDAKAKTTPTDADKVAPLPANATVKDVLDRVSEVYRSAKTLQMDGTIFASMRLAGKVETKQDAISLRFERPNKLRLVSGSGQHNVTVVSTGKNLYTYVADEKLYSKAPAPVDLTKTPQPQGQGMNTLALLSGNDISPYIKNAKLLPSEKIDGMDTYVIGYSRTITRPGGPDGKKMVRVGKIEEKTWIGKQDFLIRQMSSTHTMSAQALSQIGQGKKPSGPLVVSQKTLFRTITANAQIPGSSFKFTPPAGAKEFKPSKAVAPQKQSLPPPPPDISGKAAPQFAMPTIGGEKVSLSDNSGKPVLIVFWATMSETAKQGMPEYQKLHDELKGSDITMIGIDLDADKQVVTKYINDNGITFPILFGFNEAFTVANQYGLRHLPTMFVVGKDGKVAGKIIGPKSADELKSELAKLGIWKGSNSD